MGGLNTFGDTEVSSVSCAAPGACSATGTYLDGDGYQGFAVSQVAGVWGTAIAIPGLAGLNTNGEAEVGSVSCAAPGACSATGTYLDGDGYQGFVVSQVAGAWGTATPIPGLATLNTGFFAAVGSVSCAAPGECSATGSYEDVDGYQGFVVSQVAGTWGTAITIPGLGGCVGFEHRQQRIGRFGVLRGARRVRARRSATTTTGAAFQDLWSRRLRGCGVLRCRCRVWRP